MMGPLLVFPPLPPLPHAQWHPMHRPIPADSPPPACLPVLPSLVAAGVPCVGGDRGAPLEALLHLQVRTGAAAGRRLGSAHGSCPRPVDGGEGGCGRWGVQEGGTCPGAAPPSPPSPPHPSPHTHVCCAAAGLCMQRSRSPEQLPGMAPAAALPCSTWRMYSGLAPTVATHTEMMQLPVWAPYCTYAMPRNRHGAWLPACRGAHRMAP